MSRATTTVLFTDIVGSTELRGRLGDDAAEELRRVHDRLLAQAVESNGGRMIKGLGDGIMATFAGASDAVAAAVAIQQEIDRLVRSGKASLPLTVRVGVSAGDVAVDEGDVHGTPVIEASRLCAAAGGGEILVADVVRILAGSTGDHDYATVGPLTLKGLEHPVAATRVEWKPAALSTVPMPAFLTDVGRIFVGRDGEVERVGQLWKEALAGERRVALLGGEPGVGKTRLAAQVAVQVHDEGGVVLVGRSLAHHYAQAAVPAADPAKAVDYARQAGDAALAQLAHDDAVRYFGQALDLLRLSEAPVDDPQHIELLIALGEAQRRAGYPAHRQTLLEAASLARHRQDADALARAALANCRGSMTSNSGRIDFERIEALQAAMELVGQADSPTRARLMAHLALEQAWRGDREELARLSGDAVAMARRLADHTTLADVLLTGFYAIYSPSTVYQRLDQTDQLLALGEQIGDHRIAVHAYHHRARAAMELGDVSEAERCVERQAFLAAEVGEPTLRWMAALSAFGLPLVAGQIAAAEQRSTAALAMAQDAQPDAQVFYAAQMFLVRYEQGRLEEMLPSFLGFVDDPEFTVPAAQAMTAFIYCELERPEEGRRYHAPLAADRFAGIPFDHLWLIALSSSAEVADRLADTESAAVLSDLLAPYSDRFVTLHSWPLNCVSHYLALLATTLGRLNEAESHFEATADKQLRMGTPAWLAHTRYEWARMLLSRRASGDMAQAREMLGQVLSAARELGLGSIERRTVALMQTAP